MRKWLKTLLATSALVLGGAQIAHAYSSACSMHAIAVMAEGEEETATEAEQPMGQEEPTEKETVAKWVKDKFETYITPIFAGVSITSIASLAICVATSIIREKKNSKDRKEFQAALSAANDKYQECAMALAAISEACADVKEAMKFCEKANETVAEASKEFGKRLDEIAKDASKMEDVKKALCLLVQLSAKTASHSKEAMKAGILDDVSEILKISKEI